MKPGYPGLNKLSQNKQHENTITQSCGDAMSTALIISLALISVVFIGLLTLARHFQK